VNAPQIETRRLILREHRLADFPDCRAMWADPNVTRYIGGKPSTEQQTWLRFLGFVGLWSVLDFGYWAIEERTSGQFIGQIGFADFKREIDAQMRTVPELGWVLAAPFHGRGYATEAVRAAVAWGDEYLAESRTVCIIDPANRASVRVAEKCGYTNFRRTLFMGEPAMFLERLTPKPS
jgi:RimJ/RimL family protein N-acetyltransferase